jgi:hypothetical protein
MSGGKGKGPADDQVGYRKPPRHRTFKPGKSGNPKGRPPGARGKHKLQSAILQRAREIIVEEGDRKVTVREGDKLVTMDAFTLAVRATHNAAIKGSAMAQRTVIQTRLAVKAEIGGIMNKVFHEAAVYKEECELKRRQCREAGLAEPNFLPHPDDITLDWETLTVEFRGPVTFEQREALQKLLGRRDEWQEDFEFNRERYERGGQSDPSLYLALESQLRYDAVNECLPERYCKPLPQRIPGDLDTVAERIKRTAAARKRQRAGRQRREKPADSDLPS